MERNGGILRAIFAGVEPIIIGLVTSRQWLVLLWLCNLFVIVLRYNTWSQSKTSTVAGQVFWYKSHMHDLRTQNNYFWAISFLAIVAWLVAYILESGDQFAKIALALMTAGISYRIIAAVTHGLKNTWSQWLSKIFGCLIFVGLWWALLWSVSGQQFFVDLPYQLEKLITIPKAMAPSSNDIRLVNNLANKELAIPATGATNSGSMTTIKSNDISTSSTTKDNKTPLSFAQVVPALVKKYNLPIPTGTIKFTNIASTSELYNDFKAWYAARFFGPSINPSTTVSCNVYFVMLGLAQKWQVTYSSSTIFDAYRAEAIKHWQTYWCSAGANVTETNLPY